MTLSATSLRAARGLLDWSQRRLAEEADVSVASIKRLERGVEGTPVVENAVVAALTRQGVLISPSAGDLADFAVEACVALVRTKL